MVACCGSREEPEAPIVPRASGCGKSSTSRTGTGDVTCIQSARCEDRASGVKDPLTVPQDQEPQQQVTIRLVTDDPNVIIYWLGDEKGD